MPMPFRRCALRRLLLPAFCAFALAGAAPVASAAPGDPITSFASSGVYYEFFEYQDHGENFDALGFAVRPEDGGPLVLGNAWDGHDRCHAVQLTADGRRDPSFARGGELFIAGIGGEFYCSGFTDAAFTPDRLYVIATTAFNKRILALTRSGEQIMDWAGDGAYECLGPCQDLIALPDGRLIASSEDGRLERISADGVRDPGFAGPSPAGSADNFRAGALRIAGDRLLLVGNVDRDYPQAPGGLLLARQLDTGAPATVFAGSDRIEIPYQQQGGQLGMENFALAVAPDGGFLITSHSQDSTVQQVHRFTAAGVPDSGWGEGGAWTIPSSLDPGPAMPISALTLDDAGRVLLVSPRTPPGADGRQVLMRLTAAGQTDTSFGGTGYVTLAAPDYGGEVANQWAVGVAAVGETALVGGLTSKKGKVDWYTGYDGNQLVPAVWAFDNSGEESYCLLPPDDGGEFEEAGEVPAGGTVGSPGVAAAARRTAAPGVTKARIRFGPVDAVGCFSQTSPGHWTNNSPTVRINGIDVITGSETLDFDTNAWKVSSGGLPVELRVGGMPIYAGALSHDFHSARLFWQNGLTGRTFTVKGLKLNGKAQAEFFAPAAGTGSTKLTLTATIPGTAGFKGFSVADGAVELGLQASNDKGLQWPAVKGSLGQLGVGPFGIKDGSLAYDFAEQAWSMEALVGLPFPAVPFVGGGATVKNGHLTGFTAKAETKIPLGTSPFFLTAMNFGFSSGDDGATLTGTGGATVAFGPPLPVPGGENGALSGAVQGTYSSGRPGSFALTGDLKMVNVPLSDGRVAFTTDLRKIDFEGRARLHGQVGALDLYKAEGKLFGWFDPAANWQAQGNVQNVRFLKWQFPNAQALASSKGMGVCVAPGKDSPRIGFGYDYKRFSAIADQCDVGQFAAVRSAGSGARAAGSSRRARVRVRRGQELAVLAVEAAKAPAVTVAGPGLRLRTPADGSAQTGRYLVGQSASDATTYVVLMDPRPGTYRISTDQPIRGLAAAEELPEVDVRAQITGTGDQRTLRWRSTRVAGQSIRFVATGPDGAVRELVAAGGASGSAAFAAGEPGTHTVTALVERHGTLRASVEVATYAVGGSPALTAPAKLKARRRGGRVTVRWAPVTGAARYRVRVAGASRKPRTLTAKKSRASFKAPAARRLRLTVVALGADGTVSPAARLTVRPAR